MGYVSDHTRSRWGRRRPYILSGAILSGIIFALMWQLPAGHSQNFYFWFFLIGTNIFYLAYTIFATPFIALGYELTPDYHERTRLMGFSNFLGQFAWVAVPWFYAIMENKRLFDNSVQGARGLAIAVGLVVIVIGLDARDLPPRTLPRHRAGRGIRIDARRNPSRTSGSSSRAS